MVKGHAKPPVNALAALRSDARLTSDETLRARIEVAGATGKMGHQWMPLRRWICIFNGVGSVALAIMEILLAHGAAPPYTEWLILFSLLFFAKAGFWLGITFRRWNGDIKLRLFLRLIREHEDEEH